LGHFVRSLIDLRCRALQREEDPMTRSSVLAIAMFVTSLASPPPARADYDNDADARVDKKPRWEGAFGMYIGSFKVAWFDGVAVGVHGDLGVRFDRLLVFGEYSITSISNDPAQTGATDTSQHATPPAVMPAIISGIVQRVGANARYSLGRLAGGHRVRMYGDFWFEAGLGEQFVRWNEGGALHRPDVALGVGAQMSLRWGDHHQHHVGFYYAFKATIAPSPYASSSQTATCAGPCDTPTRPLDVDGQFLFNLGVVFGK
jgi:hypothetical protein